MKNELKRIGRRGKLLTAFVSVALGLAACGGSTVASSGDEVTVGLLANLTGQAAPTFGKPFSQGFEMAMDDAKTSGTLSSGLSIVIKTMDAKSETAGAVTGFNRLAQSKVPIVVQDSQSPLGQAIAPLANDQSIALMSGAGSKLENAKGFAFRFTDLVTTTATTAQYLQSKGYKRVGAVVATDNPSFAVLAQASEAGLPNGFVIKEEISSSDTNFAAVLENLREAKLDAVVLSVLPQQVGNILVQMKQAGGFEGVQPVGTLATSAEAHTIGGDAAQRLVFPQAWAPGAAGSAEFERNYNQKYGQVPTAYAGLGYQVGWITAAAIEHASGSGKAVTGESVRDALPAASTGDIVKKHGILDLTINADGSATTKGTLAKFSADGKVVSAGKD